MPAPDNKHALGPAATLSVVIAASRGEQCSKISRGVPTIDGGVAELFRPDIEVCTARGIDRISVNEVAGSATHEANPCAMKEIVLRPGTARRAVDVLATTPSRVDCLGCGKL